MACLPRTCGCFFPRWLTAAAVLLALSACGGGGSYATPAPAPAPAPEPATLTLAGSSAQVLAGGKPVALTATASANAGTLNWSLGAGNPGSLSAVTGAAVNYLPPAPGAVGASIPVTITVSGTGVTRSFALTVYPEPGAPGLSLIAGDVNGYPSTNGAAADVDGRGANAVFSDPRYIAVDPAGAMYVIENNESRPPSSAESSGLNLRKIAADGSVTTVVSQYAWSSPGANYPPVSRAGGIAVDKQGNLYISDVSVATGFMTSREGGGSIVKITAGGMASLFAGKHITGQQLDSMTGVDGVGENARFRDPEILGFDADGNLYVKDAGVFGVAGGIRKITPDRGVTTVATLPAGFGADAEGNVYLSEGSTVVRVASNGSRTVVAGVPGEFHTTLGPLPGRLAGGQLARLGPASFAIISRTAIVKLVLPH